jgi:oligoendopeptidase F
MFKKDGARFLPKYEEFLRLAGSDTAENVVKRTVGQDIEKTAFWTAAIKSLEEPLDRLQALLPKVLPESE